MQNVMTFICFLDRHSGSLTFIVTFVYVLATIAICVANIRTANVSHKQLAEARKQFEEENRAFISVNIELVRNALIALHIVNIGRRVANDVKITVEPQFFENLPDEFDRNNLNRLSKSSFTLGIGQSFYTSVCGSNELEKLTINLMQLNITYSDSVSQYEETTLVDLSQYYWALLYQSPLEDTRQELRKIANSAQRVSKILDKVEKKLKLEETKND